MVITGLARSLRESGEDERSALGRRALFERINAFGRAQFKNGDFARPHTGLFYRSDTGAWQTSDRDCLESTWADLIVTALVGLVPRDDDHTLEVHPLLPPPSEGGWTHFCLDGLPYRGRLLTLVWDDPTHLDDAYNDGDKGFTVYVDGRRLHHQSDLSPFAVPLPSRPDSPDRLLL